MLLLIQVKIILSMKEMDKWILAKFNLILLRKKEKLIIVRIGLVKK
jgi:hypothetical protein